MKKLLLGLFLNLGLVFSAYGLNVTGKVVDSESTPLAGVTAQLVHYPDSVRKGFSVSTAKGVFNFKGISAGEYALHLTMIGMDEVVKPLIITNETSKLDLGSIVMTETSVTLSEMVVTGLKPAVVAKQDTIEFNAGSFKTQTNSSVEDLLKKLPGLEVGSDGSISSGGKTVTKILVDGKEFFSDDPTMASKNLPSDIVDKVQVVDRKSDLARLTGVDDGEEETVINLTIKKDMKNGWFGKVGGGYGTDSRYQGSLNISTITDNNQISIVGGANNINDLRFSDSGRGRFNSFGPSGGITSSQLLGLNFNVGKTEKFRVGGNVQYTHSDRKATSLTDTQYLFPDSVSYKNDNSTSRDIGHNLRADFRMEWKIDDNNTLDFRPQFSLNDRNSELSENSLLRAGDANQTAVNSDESKRFNHGRSYNASGRLIFNHNFASRPGRSFSVHVNYQFSDTKQYSTTWSDIEYFLRQEDSEALYRYIDNRQWSNSVSGRLSWTEPLGDVKRGNFLQFAYNMSYRFNNADKYTYDVPFVMEENFQPDNLTSVPLDAIYNTGLSNRFRNKFMTQELQVGYKKVNRDYNLEAGLIFSPSSSSSTDLINSDKNIPTRYVWNVAPFAMFRYKFSKTKSLYADYRARTSSPSLTQLQPVADESDPLHVVKGNPDLKPTFTQSLNVRFNNFNQETQQSIFATGRLQYSTNVIINKTTTEQETGKRTTTYENANGNFSGFGMFMINQPLSNKSWRVNGRLRANYSSSAGYINEQFNRSGNLGLSPSAGVTFTSDIFQMSVNPRYTFSMASSTLAQQQNRYTHGYGFNSDAALYFDFGLNVTTDLRFDKTSGYSSGYNSTSWLWNAEVSYSFLRDKCLTLSVKAYDLLAQKKNISRSVSANQITDSQYNDLTRYVMFGITYSFNTLKNKARNGQPDSDMNFGPMPGMGGDRTRGGFGGPTRGMGGGPR